ncbi:MAG: hypothetical protein AB7G23_20215 [Vicinamibacterales bacterium]
MRRWTDWLPATRGQVRELWQALADQAEATTAALERIQQQDRDEVGREDA